MKTGYGGCLVAVLLLTVPLTGAGVWELLQRHRFEAASDRLQAALDPFQARAAVIGKDGNPLRTASGRTGLPYVVLLRTDVESWERRERIWNLGAVFVDPEGLWLPFKAEIMLVQNRKVLLGGPELLLVRPHR